METYRLVDFTFTYPQKEKAALLNINLTIANGDFITICGQSGCGKTTLLRQLKSILGPHGERKGEIYYSNQRLESIDQRTQASEIGYVLQSPDNQIVTDKVWHELAFGLESLGYDNKTIRLRVAEMASFFGIQAWFHKKVEELSGGQKQLLNLASIMVMQPSVLILDEPTSQLDPIAAGEFLETIKKINRELGTTIIMTEHRLEEIIPMSDRLIVMEKGRILADASPQQVGQQLRDSKHPMFYAMTTPMRIYASVQSELPCPLTVKDGRKWLDNQSIAKKEEVLHDKSIKQSEAIIELKDVWFKYEKKLPDIIKDLTLQIQKGQLYCIVGGNGTGKTTALSIIGGLNRPYRGKVIVNGSKVHKKGLLPEGLAMLPQNPQTLFVKKTVELDLLEMLEGRKLSKQEVTDKVKEVVQFAELEDLLQSHPYDLSGGEQQRAALAKVLLLEPKIILLDEPTKGLDEYFKEKLAKLLYKLKSNGVTIVMVSHDIEFCAKYADRCAMFFDGSVITVNDTKQFFAGNSFYTTAANRMARHLCRDAITVEDVIELCR